MNKYPQYNRWHVLYKPQQPHPQLDPIFIFVCHLVGWMHVLYQTLSPNFYGTVNHWLYYGAIDGLSHLIILFQEILQFRHQGCWYMNWLQNLSHMLNNKNNH